LRVVFLSLSQNFGLEFESAVAACEACSLRHGRYNNAWVDVSGVYQARVNAVALLGFHDEGLRKFRDLGIGVCPLSRA
jgi:hypothetical protein